MNNSAILIRIKCADSAVHLHFKRITDNLFVGSSLNVKHTDSSSEENKMCIYKDNLDWTETSLQTSYSFHHFKTDTVCGGKDFLQFLRLCSGTLTSWTVCIQPWRQYFGSLTAFPTTNPSL